jgi:GxxExxY protein
MNDDERGCSDSLTEQVIAAIFEVSNTLGAGFLEKVYERALVRELGLRGIRAVAQSSCAVIYKGQYVGEYFADIIVEDVLVIELKCVERLTDVHTAQCLNYLRASGRTVCLLVNFQRPRVEWRRIVSGFRSSAVSSAPKTDTICM